MLPPGSISIAFATLMCFFATIYSLWMLPFNRTATLLHFGLTALGISRVLGGILSSAELTGSGMDSLCGTSRSSASAVNFCLESLPCSIQNAAIAWLST